MHDSYYRRESTNAIHSANNGNKSMTKCGQRIRQLVPLSAIEVMNAESYEFCLKCTQLSERRRKPKMDKTQSSVTDP
jgi:hypothetical protein